MFPNLHFLHHIGTTRKDLTAILIQIPDESLLNLQTSFCTCTACLMLSQLGCLASDRCTPCMHTCTAQLHTYGLPQGKKALRFVWEYSALTLGCQALYFPYKPHEWSITITLYRTASHFPMLLIFVFEPCIQKYHAQKFEDCTTCYVHMQECTNISKNRFM